MKPRTLSASSLNTALGCLRRYEAENILYTPNMNNPAAMVGTSVHYALEKFVMAVKFEKSHGWELDKLLAYYDIGYMETFGNGDFESAEYLDGLELTKNWFARTNLTDTNVISCEVKSRFKIKTSAGDIPFTYIWDRCDQISETEIRVVDYKSIRARVTAEQLKQKIQPRGYALAAQIQFPKATKIWVEFDLLRHESVGAVFSKEDNAITYRRLQREAERILATPDGHAPETLNPECGYCVRKAECKTLQKNIDGGGIFSLSLDDVAERKKQVADQLKGLKILDETLNEVLLTEAKARDLFEFETERFNITLTARATRKANSKEVMRILGPELTAAHGNMTVTSLDKLIKSGVLNDDQIREIKQYISKTYGEPTPKIMDKPSF